LSKSREALLPGASLFFSGGWPRTFVYRLPFSGCGFATHAIWAIRIIVFRILGLWNLVKGFFNYPDTVQDIQKDISGYVITVCDHINGLVL
jgi:hypothetical protein